jgi:adenylate cyclase
MIAALKLRDYAICYGESDKISVTVITLGEQKPKLKFGSNALYNNLSREGDLFSKRRRDRNQVFGSDSTSRRLEAEIEPPVGEVALVFTDIKSSTLLWDANPVAMRSAIKIHNDKMRRQLRIVGGYEVKTEGDAFMVSFPSPTSALLWCFYVQQQLLDADWPAEILETKQCREVVDAKGHVIFRGLSVRMGVHWGSPVCELDVVTRRMDYFGPMVNRASRISAIADGGQIAMSSDFLRELNTLNKIHDDIAAGRTTISDAYHGNVRAGEIIEREIASLQVTGTAFYELGERRLKGLETPDFVTLAIPKDLEERFTLFQNSLTQEEESKTMGRIVGALPVDAIFGLRTISLKLENICSQLNSQNMANPGPSETLSNISERLDASEEDVVRLFMHIVTRIEHCVASLQMRQILGGPSGIDFKNPETIFSVIDQLASRLEPNRVGRASGFIEDIS